MAQITKSEVASVPDKTKGKSKHKLYLKGRTAEKRAAARSADRRYGVGNRTKEDPKPQTGYNAFHEIRAQLPPSVIAKLKAKLQSDAERKKAHKSKLVEEPSSRITNPSGATPRTPGSVPTKKPRKLSSVVNARSGSGSKIASVPVESILYQYTGQFLGYGANGTAVTILERQEREMHFRDSLFRRSGVEPGSKFVYTIYDTGSGSRSEIGLYRPVSRSYDERKLLADRVNDIIGGLTKSDVDFEA